MQRQIKRLLVANRGEIAIRILQACHELPENVTTYAIYTKEDSAHTTLGRPDHALELPSPASYMNVDTLLDLVRRHKIDAVHPGYGFLSESPDFSHRLASEADCMVIGPGAQALERTGDKLEAKQLAAECSVPVLKAMSRPTSDVEEVKHFARDVGLPIMIKAVDGGGGRGIRLVSSDSALQNAVERCIGESPSNKVFAEQAAVNGFKHIEIQIIGDGKGDAYHLWERDCSVQRRFQKIVEIAPTPTDNRTVIAEVIKAALRMAKHIHYLGLGTFEFLVNVGQGQFFFLEINPRLQVEHTISESIAGIDLVREQLLIAQGIQQDWSKFAVEEDAVQCPKKFSMQWRLCAEDPDANFSLSIGKVQDVRFPSGNGIRVDSHLSQGGVVGSDFDNLMAKIIVTAATWNEVITKSQRALADTVLTGVKSNLSLLRAIAADQGFQSGQADTEWLEKNIKRLVQEGIQLSRRADQKTNALPPPPISSSSKSSAQQASNSTGTTTAFRKGDAWSLTLEPINTQKPQEDKKANKGAAAAHHLRIDKITRNDFPESLSAEISYTTPGANPQAYKLTVNSTTASSDATSSTHRRGDPKNKAHITLPMSGKLVEVLVDEGDEIQEGQVVAFVKQMKMELEIRSPRAGRVKWVIELENEGEDGGGTGDDVAEGVLLAELELDGDDDRAHSDLRSKL